MNPFAPSFDLEPYAFRGHQLAEVAMPLGGIGAGCVSFDGRGGLRDWEIYGRPNKRTLLESAFPALFVHELGKDPLARNLQGPRSREWMGEGMEFWDYGHGRFFRRMDGLPGLDSATFYGTFPVARIAFEDAELPVEVTAMAWSPFVKDDVDASGFPVAQIVYRLRNRSDQPVEAAIAWTLHNPVGAFVETPAKAAGTAVSRGIRFSNAALPEGDPNAGEAMLLTDWPDFQACPAWSEEGWWDDFRTFWTRFRTEGTLRPAEGPSTDARRPGTLLLRVRLEPGEHADLPFTLVWHFPNRERYWNRNEPYAWRVHYATRWPDVAAVADAFFAQQSDLLEGTLKTEAFLYDQPLPPEILASAAYPLSTLVSPTVLRLEDGAFWAWEGCSGQEGCCEGTCSHVWNYALGHEALFPQIQDSFLASAFGHGFRCGPEGERGAMRFRLPVPMALDTDLWHAASDGQLGQIVQVWRRYQARPDTDWLRSLWPGVKRAMAYAWVQWDRDQDGLVDGDQHNTYDINFQGPNPLTQFFYLAALRACAAIAETLGEDSANYRNLAQQGGRLAEERLWNGEYFEQAGNFEDPASIRYQHGKGCLSDQLFGQLSASLAGLGHTVDPAKVRSALQAIFRHNFRNPLGKHENLQRVYAFPEEGGLLLCTWPRGEMPAYPFVYSDEVWTGIEYQVATHLLLEGQKDEALAIVRAIRARYDGRRRNPFNEIECGSHYARALASWGLRMAWG